MKYFGGCDVGSTYTKCVILDENGKIVADVTNRSKINPVQSAEIALKDACDQVEGLTPEKLTYLIGTGYGRNKVPFADENISEISCHAMGVHVTNPSVKAIIDIGGQDVKGIAIDTDGTVKNFAMNDKCAAGTGRFFEAMAHAFEMSLPEFSKLSLKAKNTIPITAQCTVFAESEVISLVGEGTHIENIRVSKSALSQGLNFQKAGSVLAEKYKENDADKAVQIVYITDKSVDFKLLEKLAAKNYDITETLNHIMQNIKFDCAACNLKPICDEVEGMRELHFKHSGMK